MIGAFALLLFAGSVAQAGDLSTQPLPDLFVSACLDGQARLSPGSAEAVSFDALPQDLQRKLGRPASAQVWRLNSGGRAYLYVLNYAPGQNTTPRICGLASDAMDYNSAADLVERRVTGEVEPRTERSVQWLDVHGGYKALATTAGDFKVLQVNWLSDDARRTLAKVYQQVTP
jgi:hypothetical protein